jgi:hypothetical protein
VKGLALVLGMAAMATSSAAMEQEAQPFNAPPLTLMQIANPADKSYQPSSQPSTTATTPLPPERKRFGTWEMPPVTVVGERPPELREEDRIGTYAQPRWTADRRFPGTRTYVIPENKIEFEYWLKPEIPRKGATEYESLYELELGLPRRFQLDLYFIQDWEANGGKRFNGEAIEVRYALADWGKIWGNPALYLEYTFKEDSPDLVEGKLLLTDELAPRWHWGVNLSFETEIAGPRSREYEITAGLSYTVIDEKFSVGVETEDSIVDDKFSRGSFKNEVKIGPSLQWRPLPQIHIDFAPLFGVTNQSPAAKIYLVIGYEF